jgi:flagellar secretion chaperone FliS
VYGRPNLLRAQSQYKSLELASRVEGASPHALVGILYDELLRSLDVLSAALRQGRDIAREPSTARARSILTALSASLNFDQGGGVAQTLAGVYRAMTLTLSEATTKGDAAKLAELRDGVATISESWKRLI